MNNYYTLIYLIREIRPNITGALFHRAVTPFKDVLELYFENRHNRFRIIFNASKEETVFFQDQYRPPKKKNALEFFPEMEGQKCTGIELAEYDRLVTMFFENGLKLVAKVFGSANMFLVDDEKIVSSFEQPDKFIGESEPKPKAPDIADEVRPNAKAKNQMLERNPLLPRPLLPALITANDVDEMEPDEVVSFTDHVTRQLLENPTPRVLSNGHVCLWDENLLPMETLFASDSVTDCVRHAYRETVRERRLDQEKSEWEQQLERRIRKAESRLKQLRNADKELERAEEYEKWGHLLMANVHREDEVGQQKIEVKDLYEANEPLEIPLKPELNLAENAERYYDKASDARASYKASRSQLKSVENRLQKLKSLKSTFDEIEYVGDFKKWLKQHRDDLNKLGVSSGNNEDEQRQPYRKMEMDGYEILIGKNARSNDELLSSCHKEDIWLHARGVGGSHVIVRMNNEKSYPPKHILEKAAAMAAFHSKARGSDVVPVQYTKRKYVRKPKGGNPGQVVVQFEEVILIQPVEPQKLTATNE